MTVSQTGNAGLSVEERAIFFDVVELTLFISNQEQFIQWTQTELQRIFPHGMLACGIGHVDKKGAKVQHVISCNFPQEYLQSLQCPNEMMNSPILAKWRQEKQPILFEPHADCNITNAAPSEWLDNFHRFELLNLAAHGQYDVNSQTASYFSFSSIPGKLLPHHSYMLKLLVPHLHAALARVVANLLVKSYKRSPPQSQITKRELEILKWLCNDKTNWEIAQILSISEATVKNHVHSLLNKLDVNTRAQAVTKATKLKLNPSKPRRSMSYC